MGEVTLTLDEYEALKRLTTSERESEGATLAQSELANKPKPRKASRYNKEYARQYHLHRAKHPRMSHAQITSMAHKGTKKALK